MAGRVCAGGGNRGSSVQIETLSMGGWNIWAVSDVQVSLRVELSGSC